MVFAQRNLFIQKLFQALNGFPLFICYDDMQRRITTGAVPPPLSFSVTFGDSLIPLAFFKRQVLKSSGSGCRDQAGPLAPGLGIQHSWHNLHPVTRHTVPSNQRFTVCWAASAGGTVWRIKHVQRCGAPGVLFTGVTPPPKRRRVSLLIQKHA